MDNDDRMVGRILTRREFLGLMAAASAGLLVACAVPGAENEATPASTAISAAADSLPACIVRPEMTEGPYFVDEQLNRSNIRIEPSDGSEKPGVPVTLIFNVTQVADNTCAPLAGAVVDVWHCDAQGVYSGVTDRTFDTTGMQFLRGYQLTDENGRAAFETIYPGWYSGRTVHIHFKIRTDAASQSSYEFTSQLFFDDSLSDEVFTQEPYTSKGIRDTRNSADNIYQNGGDQLLLDPSASDGGYVAVFNIGLDLTDTQTGQPDGMSNAGPPRP